MQSFLAVFEENQEPDEEVFQLPVVDLATVHRSKMPAKTRRQELIALKVAFANRQASNARKLGSAFVRVDGRVARPALTNLPNEQLQQYVAAMNATKQKLRPTKAN